MFSIFKTVETPRPQSAPQEIPQMTATSGQRFGIIGGAAGQAMNLTWASESGTTGIMYGGAEVAEAEPVVAPPKPALKPPLPAMADWRSRPDEDAYLIEYASLAASIGIAPSELAIDEFRKFMAKHDLPIYSLPEVIAYMDDKSAREAKSNGWCWLPLREKDKAGVVSFGRQGRWTDSWESPPRELISASDLFLAEREVVYPRTVPLHALRRIDLIEREHKHPIAFFISDYAPAPEFRADPFLMAVVPNPELASGVGRFVIDFWDEPGFGIDKMLK